MLKIPKLGPAVTEVGNLRFTSYVVLQPSQHDGARLPEILSMGSLDGGYGGGQRADGPPPVASQQQQPPMQVTWSSAPPRVTP